MKKRMSQGITSAVFVFFFLCLCPQSTWAQEVPKVEIGPLFTLVSDFDETETGFGGRLTLNPHPIVGVEAEVSHYPDTFANGDITTGLFGIKLTARREYAAVFAKVRPGFARVNFDVPVLGNFDDTEFAIDFGGGIELFPSKWIGLRFDVADLYIRDVSNDPVVEEFIRGSKHNLLFTAGITFRF